jgi:N-acetylglucosamine malate deacetylase 1
MAGAPNKTAIAIAAHPDDIELMMAGTLLLLESEGWEIHCFNLSSGNLGSMTTDAKGTSKLRRNEAKAAAKSLGAVWHPPIANDLQIFYEDRAIRRVCSVIREINPSIVLTHSPEDYMEDHMNSCRLTVSAAFARGFPNYRSIPERKPVAGETTIYHALPHLLRDPLGRRVEPGIFVNIAPVMESKREALACHKSQGDWLDATQGMGSYLHVMEDMAAQVGKLSGRFSHAEGWQRRFHAGFCGETTDPLREALGRNHLQGTTSR